MKRRDLLLSPLLVPLASRAQRPAFRNPLPAGIPEHRRSGIKSIVPLKDGTVLANNGRRSSDQGKSWSEPRAFGPGVRGDGLVRLASGAILLTQQPPNLHKVHLPTLHVSRDEGNTWQTLPASFPRMFSGPNFFGDELVQTRSGRLIWPCSIDFNPKFSEFLYENVQARSEWRGKVYQTEGHQHLPEIYLTFIAYSDDEGQSWKLAEGYYKSPLALWGWFDERGIPNGYGGHTSFGECTAAETRDGRVLVYGRSEVGRVVATYSDDNGITWHSPLPKDLANSGSPVRLRRIERNGDLMIVWNQVSHEEIRRGYRRGRLSAAISPDNGETWGHFKTLELSDGLEDIARVAPEYPIKMTRARDSVGRIPENYAYFHYANAKPAGDQVYIHYLRGSPALGIAEQGLGEQEEVLRVYPLEWFYS